MISNIAINGFIENRAFSFIEIYESTKMFMVSVLNKYEREDHLNDAEGGFFKLN
jgi:hypothetical protein